MISISTPHINFQDRTEAVCNLVRKYTTLISFLIKAYHKTVLRFQVHSSKIAIMMPIPNKLKSHRGHTILLSLLFGLVLFFFLEVDAVNSA